MILRLFTLFIIAAQLLVAQNNNSLMNKYALARSYENSGEFDKAAELYEELYQLDRNNNLYFESLNRIYVQLKNYAASVSLIENEIYKWPKDINLYGLLGSSYYLMGNEEKAFQVWDEPFAISDPNPVFYRVIASYAVERRAFEKAIELYQRGKELSQDKIVFSYDLSRLYSLTMQYENAAEEFCNILELDPLQLKTIETRILAYKNKPKALENTIGVVEKFANDNNLSFSFLLARLYTENKEFDKAFEVYLTIDENQSQQGRELFNYADFLLKEGECETSKNVYKSIIELYPNSPLIPSVKLGYAKSLEEIMMNSYVKNLPLWKPYFKANLYETKEVEEVISAFSEVADAYKNSDPGFEALLRIGIIKFYLQNKFVEAKKYFDKIIKGTGTGITVADAYNGLAEIALLKGNLADAESKYSRIPLIIKVNYQKVNEARYKLARIKFYQGDFKQAQKLLAEVLKNLKDDNANDALELSFLLNTSKLDSSNLVLFAEAEFLADQKRFSEAAKKYKLIVENPQAFLLHSISSMRLAEMELAKDNYDKAVKLFENVANEGEKNIYADKALYLLAQIYQYGIFDDIKAVELYEELLVKFPSSIYIDSARSKLKKLKGKIS